MKRDQKILLLTGIIIIGLLISVLYHIYQGGILGKPYPYTTFLFSPVDRFNDFRVARFSAELNPYFNNISTGGQFPLVNFIYFLFTLIPLNASLLLFIILISTSFALLTNIILWGEKSSVFQKLNIILPISFLTYPFLFSIDRGNLEILLFIFLLIFLYLFQSERYTLSAIFLGIAIAMKLFPGVLLVLYLPKKKFREIILSVCVTALLTLGCLALFKGGFKANLDFLLGDTFFAAQSWTIASNNLVQRGVSIFTIIKIFLIETGRITSINMPQFLSIYIKLAALSFVPLAAYVIFVEKILWRKVALLVFSMLLLPQISGDYKLIHIYLPMFVFLISDDRSSLDIYYLIIFGLLMIPKDYAYFLKVFSDAGANDISISVVINIMLMLLMSGLIIISGVKEFLQEKILHKNVGLVTGSLE